MLNPLRNQLNRSGAEADRRATPFSARADEALARFGAFRRDLEGQVRRGDLTVKVARERAAEFAAGAKADLRRQAEGFSPTPRAFLDRLIEATEAKRRAREGASIESLQRETNRLLRQSVVEMQLVARAGEFEARTFARPMGGGVAAPTLDALLGLARASAEGGDEVAAEWSRRQLEAFRPLVHEPEDLRRIDLACDRPDVVNARLVETYLAALDGRPGDALLTFIERSIEAGDANACVASFLLARRLDPGGDDPVAASATRKVLAGLGRFPDAALATLRAWEADARAADAEAAAAQADFAASRLDVEVRLPGLEAPTAAEIDRVNRLAARPRAEAGEAIGLDLARRGRFADEADPDASADAPEAGPAAAAGPGD